MIKTPHLATDGIIEIYDGDEFQGVVLIERKNRPKGLAIPGGFVDIGEKVEDACIREMKEETTLDVELIKLLGVYSDPKRDERFHCVSCVYVCRASGVPKGEDDAKSAKIYKIENIPFDELCFDHSEILRDYLENRDKDF